jgi:UTP-glucose-1-phosphate uridylyltransferase
VDALRTLLAGRPVHAFELEGVRFDCGSKLGRSAGQELADLAKLPVPPFRPHAAASAA